MWRRDRDYSAHPCASPLPGPPPLGGDVQVRSRRICRTHRPRPHRSLPHIRKHPPEAGVFICGGETGIRTLEGHSPQHAFQACALNRSAISPVNHQIVTHCPAARVGVEHPAHPFRAFQPCALNRSAISPVNHQIVTHCPAARVGVEHPAHPSRAFQPCALNCSAISPKILSRSKAGRGLYQLSAEGSAFSAAGSSGFGGNSARRGGLSRHKAFASPSASVIKRP